MKSNKIYASIYGYSVLENGKPKLIGFRKLGQTYLRNGVVTPELIVFNYGTKSQCIFAFINDELAWNNVCPSRPWYIHEKYVELTGRDTISAEEFLREIVFAYTLKEMRLNS